MEPWKKPGLMPHPQYREELATWLATMGLSPSDVLDNDRAVAYPVNEGQIRFDYDWVETPHRIVNDRIYREARSSLTDTAPPGWADCTSVWYASRYLWTGVG